MGLNISSVAEIIKDFLQTNLVDPATGRFADWVYADGARLDLDKSAYPKILIKKIEQPSLKEQLAIGNVSTENRDELIIQIKDLFGDKYTYLGEERTASQLVSEIARQSADLIQENHDFFVAQGLLDVTMKKDEPTEDKDRNPIFNQTIEVHYISTPD